MRKHNKKLEGIAKIEEKLAAGDKINEEQEEKLNNKEYLIKSINNILTIVKLYKEKMPQETTE